MRDPSRTAVLGRLAPFADGFVVELSALGYTAGSAVQQMCLMAHLSRWLDAEGLEPAALSPMVVERFFVARRAAGYTSLLSSRALDSLLSYLRRLGVVPAVPTSVPDGPVEELLSRYRRYLEIERGLVAGSSRVYVHWVRPFLEGLADEDGLDLARLDAAAVRRFVVGFCAGRSRRTTEVMVAALRALLRFLYFEGELSRQLVDAVPSVAAWRLSELPRRLEGEQVQGLLGACDRGAVQGRRDFAIVTVLVRLGLRAAAVAALSLDDIDWRAGEITAVGKGGRSEQLPLPVDVGEAIVAYLRRGRPKATGHRAVFLRAVAPIGPFGTNGISGIVRCACLRAGVPVIGPHRLRHTLACQMANGGVPLPEIAEVLRHHSISSTAEYARVDIEGLRTVAQPWPGGAGR